MALLYTQAHWQEDTMGPITPRAFFDQIMASCAGNLSVWLGLVIRVSELGSWVQDGESKDEERKKAFEVTFKQAEEVGFMKATFVLEKKRVNKSLKDLAAEAVARQLVDMGCFEQLLYYILQS